MTFSTCFQVFDGSSRLFIGYFLYEMFLLQFCLRYRLRFGCYEIYTAIPILYNWKVCLVVWADLRNYWFEFKKKDIFVFDSPLIQGSNLLGFITSRYSISKWRGVLKKIFNNGSEVVYKNYKLPTPPRQLFFVYIHILYLGINLK